MVNKVCEGIYLQNSLKREFWKEVADWLWTLFAYFAHLNTKFILVFEGESWYRKLQKAEMFSCTWKGCWKKADSVWWWGRIVDVLGAKVMIGLFGGIPPVCDRCGANDAKVHVELVSLGVRELCSGCLNLLIERGLLVDREQHPLKVIPN